MTVVSFYLVTLSLIHVKHSEGSSWHFNHTQSIQEYNPYKQRIANHTVKDSRHNLNIGSLTNWEFMFMYMSDTSFPYQTLHMLMIHINDDQHEHNDAPDETLSTVWCIKLLSFPQAELYYP